MTTTSQLLFSPDASPADILTDVQSFLASKNTFTILGVDIFLRDGRTNGQTTLTIDYLDTGANTYTAQIFQEPSRDLLDVAIDLVIGAPNALAPVFCLDITSVYRRRIPVPSVLIIFAGAYDIGCDPLAPQPALVAAAAPIAAAAQGTALALAPGGGVIGGTGRIVTNQRTYAWGANAPGLVINDATCAPVGGPGCCP